MENLQSRLLPRLVLDTVSCLWVAHDHVQEDLKNETRSAIASLRNADLTNSDRAAGVMCAVADHLQMVETNLHALDRPFTAKRVRDVLNRVQHLTRDHRCELAH